MFSRTISLIGLENYQKLKNSHILVLGVGGVGGYSVEALVRSGIENITIIDADNVDITNINRQLIATTENIGNSKVKEFQKRLQLINKNIKVKALQVKITTENIDLLFEERYDFIIDACDTLNVKKLLIKKCHEKHINLITVCGMGKKLNPSLVQICDIRNTTYDPLAKAIRKYVKEEKIEGSIPCVFSSEKPIVNNEKTISSMIFVPSTAGILAASYVVNNIIKRSTLS